MKINQMEEKWISTTVAIICDSCNRKYDDLMEMQEFLSFDTIGGFNSIHGDGTRIQTDICQYCYPEILGKCLRIS